MPFTVWNARKTVFTASAVVGHALQRQQRGFRGREALAALGQEVAQQRHVQVARQRVVRDGGVRGVVRGRERVLLVEDEPAVRSVVRRFLTAAGYTVLEAQNGEEAFGTWRRAAAAGTPVDVVLTDAVMPTLGGHALADRLRAADPTARVVVMSGYTARGAGDAPESRGAASAFLQKPLSAPTLLRTLRDVLDA